MDDIINRRMLGVNIKKFRQEKNYSVREFSSMTGISESHIKNLESAGASPSMNTIVKISNVLEIAIDDLLAESMSAKSRISFVRKKIDGILNICTEEELKSLLFIISLLICNREDM